MNDKFDLPSGGFFVLRDPETLTNRQRRPLLRALLAARGEGPDDVVELSDVLISSLVEEWSYPTPITSEVVADLLARDADAIVYEAQKLISRLFLDTEPNPDPASPTVPSSG